jgi:acyl-CoA reductase-like NAD-dependent aldehyde dehydrogenase
MLQFFGRECNQRSILRRMKQPDIPQIIMNWIDGRESGALAGEIFAKHSPATGKKMCQVARSRSADVAAAIDSAANAFPAWSTQPPAARGEILMGITRAMRQHQEELATVVAGETGMSVNAARAETGAAIALGDFMAGEGRRLYGRTTTSAAAHRFAMTVREPLGVAGLIIAANTRSVHRSLQFVRRVQAGVAVVNAGTYGSEPHMPFGGVKQSGNGTREPGTEALDLYLNLKTIYMTMDPSLV